jgi:hypothetical protein
MNSIVRRVLARYFEEPGELPPDMDKSWMEYLEDKSKTIDNPDDPTYDMLKGVERLDTSFNTTNPYDYENPSDKSKDQKDSPSFESNPCYPTEFGYFDKPDSYSTQGILEDWWKSREEDYTQDEDEQQPAISITRKRLASGIILPEAITHITVPGDDFFDFAMRCKVAASISEIINKDNHYKNHFKRQRADRCQVTWTNKNLPNQFERGLFAFKVSSPGSTGGPYSVYMQFLRDENKQVSTYADYPVHIGCTCPSFLYYGAQYYAVRDGYMYMPAFKPDLIAPKMQNQYTTSRSEHYPNGRKNFGRGLNFRVCKHILAVFDEIKKTPIQVHYKKYPMSAPPSKIMNKDVWKDMMKFEFTEADIKQRLLSTSPKVPAYFKRESVTPSVIDWFYNTWSPRNDDQKLKSLKEFAMYPERVFFILIEEAYLKSKQGHKISPRLVDEGYDMMANIVMPESEAKGQAIPEYADQVTKGTGKIDMPGIKPPEDEGEDEGEDTDKIPEDKKSKPKKQYGVPEYKKVKQPGRLKRPSTVQPAIK